MHVTALTQTVFHIASAMPVHAAHTHNKQRHIANDFVVILYCDHNDPVAAPVIHSEFNFSSLIVHPLGTGMYKV
jgi:hypothetical protein